MIHRLAMVIFLAARLIALLGAIHNGLGARGDGCFLPTKLMVMVLLRSRSTLMDGRP